MYIKLKTLPGGRVTIGYYSSRSRLTFFEMTGDPFQLLLGHIVKKTADDKIHGFALAHLVDRSETMQEMVIFGRSVELPLPLQGGRSWDMFIFQRHLFCHNHIVKIQVGIP